MLVHNHCLEDLFVAPDAQTCLRDLSASCCFPVQLA